MTQKHVDPTLGQSGRITVSGSELDQLGGDVGDGIDVEGVRAEEVDSKLNERKNSDEFPINTPV